MLPRNKWAHRYISLNQTIQPQRVLWTSLAFGNCKIETDKKLVWFLAQRTSDCCILLFTPQNLNTALIVVHHRSCRNFSVGSYVYPYRAQSSVMGPVPKHWKRQKGLDWAVTVLKYLKWVQFDWELSNFSCVIDRLYTSSPDRKEEEEQKSNMTNLMFYASMSLNSMGSD